MKVTYKTHPILEKLERSSLGKIPFLKEDLFFLQDQRGIDRIANSFKENCHFFKEILYVSSTFLNATMQASEKLIELYQDITVNDTADMTIKGTFIYSGNVFFLKHILRKGVQYQETTFMAFHKSGTPLAFYETKTEGTEREFGWVSNFHRQETDKDGIRRFMDEAMSNLILASMFKSYASVETKYIAANTKASKGLKTFRNDTNLGITYLTSKWFTNLVRSEGFKVRGHFRLQPKKVEGEWTKELIWIDQFEKSGYTSRAQILKK